MVSAEWGAGILMNLLNFFKHNDRNGAERMVINRFFSARTYRPYLKYYD